MSVLIKHFTEMGLTRKLTSVASEEKEGIKNVLGSSDDPKACFMYQLKKVPRRTILNLKGPCSSQGWCGVQLCSQRRLGHRDSLGELFSCTYMCVPQSNSLIQ